MWWVLEFVFFLQHCDWEVGVEPQLGKELPKSCRCRLLFAQNFPVSSVTAPFSALSLFYPRCNYIIFCMSYIPYIHTYTHTCTHMHRHTHTHTLRGKGRPPGASSSAFLSANGMLLEGQTLEGPSRKPWSPYVGLFIGMCWALNMHCYI